MDNLKIALKSAYDLGVAEKGPSDPVVNKIRFILMQHYTDLRDEVANPTMDRAPVTERQAVDFSEHFKKKAQPLTSPIAVVVNEAEFVEEPDDKKITEMLSEEGLQGLAKLSSDELLKTLGIDKLKAAATALGYKISHQAKPETFATKFLELLNEAQK